MSNDTLASSSASGADSALAPGPKAGIELAEELRRIARALIDLDVEPEAVGAALEMARKIRPHLTGPPRTRWYEAEETHFQGSGAGSAFDILSPVRGRMNPVAPPLRMEVAERDDGSQYIAGRARLANLYEGPPHGVHGGLVAALFDEILGCAMGLAPPAGVTAKLEVDYHHLTPIDEELRLEAWITEVRGRRVYAESTCHAGDTLTARATALFVRVDFKAVEDRMRARSKT